MRLGLATTETLTRHPNCFTGPALDAQRVLLAQVVLVVQRPIAQLPLLPLVPLSQLGLVLPVFLGCKAGNKVAFQIKH